MTQQQSLFVFLNSHQQKAQLYLHQQLSWPNRHILKQIKRKNLSFFLFEQKQNNKIFVLHWLQLLQRQSGKTNFLLLLNWFEEEVPFVFFFAFFETKRSNKALAFLLFQRQHWGLEDNFEWNEIQKKKEKKSYKIKLPIRFLRHQIVRGGFFFCQKNTSYTFAMKFFPISGFVPFPPEGRAFLEGIYHTTITG